MTMPRFAKRYDLDLAQFSDEALVVLAKECGYRLAETTLLLRYQDWSRRLIAILARRRGLTEADVEDAMQDAVFGVAKAITRYDTMQVGRLKGCSFRAFLRRVLTDRFKDFLKSLWRYRARYRCGTFLASRSAGQNDEGHRRVARDPHDDEADNPAHIVERGETVNRVRAFYLQLDDASRGLMERMLDGVRLRRIASDLQISYDAAKRRRRRLQGQLAAWMGEG